MGGHKTDSLNSVYLRNLPEQLSKRHRLFQIFPVGIDVLSQKHDFHNAVLCQTPDLRENLLRTAASLPAAHIGTIQ